MRARAAPRDRPGEREFPRPSTEPPRRLLPARIERELKRRSLTARRGLRAPSAW
jgi:hypothetical protein